MDLVKYQDFPLRYKNQGKEITRLLNERPISLFQLHNPRFWQEMSFHASYYGFPFTSDGYIWRGDIRVELGEIELAYLFPRYIINKKKPKLEREISVFSNENVPQWLVSDVTEELMYNIALFFPNSDQRQTQRLIDRYKRKIKNYIIFE